eukprot:scaffold175239_cov17-Tisochrysis_lutea.AAC.1
MAVAGCTPARWCILTLQLRGSSSLKYLYFLLTRPGVQLWTICTGRCCIAGGVAVLVVGLLEFPVLRVGRRETKLKMA